MKPNYTSEFWGGRRMWRIYVLGETPILDGVLFKFWDDKAWGF